MAPAVELLGPRLNVALSRPVGGAENAGKSAMAAAMSLHIAQGVSAGQHKLVLQLKDGWAVGR